VNVELNFIGKGCSRLFCQGNRLRFVVEGYGHEFGNYRRRSQRITRMATSSNCEIHETLIDPKYIENAFVGNKMPANVNKVDQVTCKVSKINTTPSTH
jgi:hypothetical protein